MHTIRNRFSLLLAFGAIVLARESADAEVLRYVASLDGAQAVPQPDLPQLPSTATGDMILDYDTSSDTFDITIELFGLLGDFDPFLPIAGLTSGAHVHVGAAGQTSPFHLYDTLGGLWVNSQGNQDVMAGDWSYHAEDQTLIAPWTIDQFDPPNSGGYLNVHSSYFVLNGVEQGEIRGQVGFDRVVGIPEPTAARVAMIGIVIFLLAWELRSRTARLHAQSWAKAS